MAPGGGQFRLTGCLGLDPTSRRKCLLASVSFAVLPGPATWARGAKSEQDDRGSWWRCPLVIGARVPKKGATVTSEGHGDDYLSARPAGTPGPPGGCSSCVKDTGSLQTHSRRPRPGAG